MAAKRIGAGAKALFDEIILLKGNLPTLFTIKSPLFGLFYIAPLRAERNFYEVHHS